MKTRWSNSYFKSILTFLTTPERTETRPLRPRIARTRCPWRCVNEPMKTRWPTSFLLQINTTIFYHSRKDRIGTPSTQNRQDQMSVMMCQWANEDPVIGPLLQINTNIFHYSREYRAGHVRFFRHFSDFSKTPPLILVFPACVCSYHFRVLREIGAAKTTK